MKFLMGRLILCCCVWYVVNASKHSERLKKSTTRDSTPSKTFMPPPLPPPIPHPLPSRPKSKYVDFDLDSRGSKNGKGNGHGSSISHYHHNGNGWDMRHHHSWQPHRDYDYDYPMYHQKDHHDYLYMIPMVLGGLGLLCIPLLTLLMTLYVNIAPASNIPTAITTAGKKIGRHNFSEAIMDFLDKLEAAIRKYGKKQ